jgi:hypothetical protein
MNDRVRLLLSEQCSKAIVFLRNVEAVKGNFPAAHIMPSGKTLLDRNDRRKRIDAQLRINPAAAQIVYYAHVVPGAREVQRARPAAKSVATKNHDFQSASAVSAGTQFAYYSRTLVQSPPEIARKGARGI